MSSVLSPSDMFLAFELRDGEFYWKARPSHWFSNERAALPWNRRSAGSPVSFFVDSGGYLCCQMNRRQYMKHRMLWLFEYGRWPTGQIDHIDGNPRNNAIENLRDVTPSVNRMNQRRRSDNKSGFTGVYHRGNKWFASAQVNGVMKFLGTFATKESAIAARLKANADLGFGPNHGRAT